VTHARDIWLTLDSANAFVSPGVNSRGWISTLARRFAPSARGQARLPLYNSLVFPLLDCSDIVWGDKNNSTLMNHLQVLQHNATRLILDLPRHSSATEALETLEGKPLYLRQNTTVVSLYLNVSIFKCLVDFDFNLTLIFHIHIAIKHARITTTTFHAHVRIGKTTIHLYHSVSEWNSLPIELKQSTNRNIYLN
jgi:hypothetical protein